MKKKSLISACLLLAISVLFCFCEPIYSAEPKKSRFEIAAMAGITVGFSDTIFERTRAIGYLSFGWRFTPSLEIEPNVFIAVNEDIVSSLNLNMNIPGSRKLVPFVGGGLGVCTHGTLFFNMGGGLKVWIQKRLGLRSEFRYFSFGEEGTTHSGGVILAGIFYSF